jgi:hypothetical protein
MKIIITAFGLLFSSVLWAGPYDGGKLFEGFCFAPGNNGYSVTARGDISGNWYNFYDQVCINFSSSMYVYIQVSLYGCRESDFIPFLKENYWFDDDATINLTLYGNGCKYAYWEGDEYGWYTVYYWRY